MLGPREIRTFLSASQKPVPCLTDIFNVTQKPTEVSQEPSGHTPLLCSDPESLSFLGLSFSPWEMSTLGCIFPKVHLHYDQLFLRKLSGSFLWFSTPQAWKPDSPKHCVLPETQASSSLPPQTFNSEGGHGVTAATCMSGESGSDNCGHSIHSGLQFLGAKGFCPFGNSRRRDAMDGRSLEWGV